ncbi:hypothetical protein BH09MYX1_BH09MYX1_66630 [soil metagenome]
MRNDRARELRGVEHGQVRAFAREGRHQGRGVTHECYAGDARPRVIQRERVDPSRHDRIVAAPHEIEQGGAEVFEARNELAARRGRIRPVDAALVEPVRQDA